MTASLRRLAGFDTDKNIFLSLRPNSVTLQPTELRLEPGVTMELPLGQFELDTVGLHSGVYYPYEEKVAPAATREWLAQFRNAEYGVGMGLTEVLRSTKEQDPMASLKILKGLSESEAECIVNCGEIPDYDLSLKN